MDRLDRRRPYWRDEEYDDEEAYEFQERHERLSEKVERFIMQLVILGLVALVLVQTMFIFPHVRKLANVVEGLEGVPYSQVTAWGGALKGQEAVPAAADSAAQSVPLTVALMSHRSAPEARLLVDGKVMANFASPTVVVRVRPGQRLAIDGSQSAETLTFRVVGAPGVSSPALGTNVTTRRNQQSLGVVRPASN